MRKSLKSINSHGYHDLEGKSLLMHVGQNYAVAKSSG
jgi:hypothetical protein